jgi:hypothetical protein
MCPFCFGSVMLLAGSVVSVVSGGGFAAAAVQRFTEAMPTARIGRTRKHWQVNRALKPNTDAEPSSTTTGWPAASRPPTPEYQFE